MTLREYLTQHRMTYDQFGLVLGVGKSQVCRWASGARVPSLEMSIAIEEATNGLVTARDFVPDRGNAAMVQKCA